MWQISGIQDRAGKVLVDEKTHRVVAYCPTGDDAINIVARITGVLTSRDAALAKLREWQDDDGEPTPLAERNRILKARNKLLTGLLAELWDWQAGVPEPLAPGLRDRLISSLHGHLTKERINARKPLFQGSEDDVEPSRVERVPGGRLDQHAEQGVA